MSFKKDIKVGKIGEKFARKKLEGLGFKTKDGDGKKVDFYWIVGDKEITCEVKYDVYAEKSGNLAIEYYNTKICKPSGIDSTICDIWFHVLDDDEIYFNFVKDLKEWIKKTVPFRDLSSVGDNNAAIKLYKKEIICGSGLVLITGESASEVKNQINSGMPRQE